MPKKYQVFVSSTFRDLVEERQDAIRNILDLNHIPAGMELFPAADQEQLTYIKKVIDECDYYLLIVGGRYGSMDEQGVNYTEREYDYAVETGKVVLAFVHEEPQAIPVGKSDVAPNVSAALEAFKAKVMTGRLVKGWTTRQNLEPLVLKALIHVFNDRPQVGWVRGDAAASENLLAQSNALLQENAALKSKLAKLQVAPVFNIPDLAGLDDSVDVGYSVLVGTNRQNRSRSLTWKEIALGFANALPQTKWRSGVVRQAINFALERAGQSPRELRVKDVDEARILIQMEALGIVQSGMASGAQGPAPTLTLTSKGRDLFIQTMAVRSNKQAEGQDNGKFKMI